MHATLTGIGEAVIVTDAQGEITILNSVAQTLTGWTDDALGRNIEEVFSIASDQSGQPAQSDFSRLIHEVRQAVTWRTTSFCSLEMVPPPPSRAVPRPSGASMTSSSVRLSCSGMSPSAETGRPRNSAERAAREGAFRAAAASLGGDDGDALLSRAGRHAP